VIGPDAARQEAAVPDGKNTALLGLLLSGIGKNDPARRGRFIVETFDNNVLA